MTTTEPRRRVRVGIRARIVAGYVVLLTIALVIAVVVTFQVLRGRLDADVDRALAQEVEELRQLANGTDPETGEPFGGDAAAIFEVFLNRNVPGNHEAFYTLIDGEVGLRSFNAPRVGDLGPDLAHRWAAVREPQRADVSTAFGDVRYLAVPLNAGDRVAGVFAVAYFLDADRAEIDQVVRVISLTGLIVLTISGVLAWSLAGRVLRPVRDLTETARGITETDIAQRIPVSGSDELAELGTTFNAMLDRLEEGFVGQRQFLDDVAHELRTPITIVRGHLEVVDDDPADREETVAVITEELDRMSRYVSDLLTLAKAEQSDFLHVEPFDLGEFTSQLSQRVASLGERHWTIDTTPRPGTIAVVADEGRVMQAMLNLASNAVDHTADGDEIGVGGERFHARGGRWWIRLWVRDSGPGIDTDHLDHVFERRFRGATSRAVRAEGMGIGLSIVDAVARAHSGRAVASNVDGGGARFTIEIPAEPDITDDVTIEPVGADTRGDR